MKLDQEKLITQKGECILLEKQIIELVIKAGETIEKEDSLLFKQLNESLSKGEPYCLLVNAGYMSNITVEARELSASLEFSRNTIAKALLVNSLGQKLVGNFYVQVNKPVVKTRLFTNRAQAIKWLRKAAAEHNKKEMSNNKAGA